MTEKKINETENRKATEKIQETKSRFSEKKSTKLTNC